MQDQDAGSSQAGDAVAGGDPVIAGPLLRGELSQPQRRPRVAALAGVQQVAHFELLQHRDQAADMVEVRMRHHHRVDAADVAGLEERQQHPLPVIEAEAAAAAVDEHGAAVREAQEGGVPLADVEEADLDLAASEGGAPGGGVGNDQEGEQDQLAGAGVVPAVSQQESQQGGGPQGMQGRSRDRHRGVRQAGEQVDGPHHPFQREVAAGVESGGRGRKPPACQGGGDAHGEGRCQQRNDDEIGEQRDRREVLEVVGDQRAGAGLGGDGHAQGGDEPFAGRALFRSPAGGEEGGEVPVQADDRQGGGERELEAEGRAGWPATPAG